MMMRRAHEPRGEARAARVFVEHGLLPPQLIEATHHASDATDEDRQRPPARVLCREAHDREHDARDASDEPHVYEAHAFIAFIKRAAYSARMRTVVVIVLLLSSACNADLVLPDEFTVGDIAGVSGTDWWMGMPREDSGELALDARLTRFLEGSEIQTFDTITLCRGSCRHIGYGGNGKIALDKENDGIELVDVAGGLDRTPLPFPVAEEELRGPWLMAGRGDTLVAASGTRVFRKNGNLWDELAPLDQPAFALNIEPNGVVVATRDAALGRLPSPLVNDEWLELDTELTEGALVAFEPDGSFASSTSIPEVDADTFVPLRMFKSGLLAARLVARTLDAVVVDTNGGVTTWASLGTKNDGVNERSFRATVFDDGTVGVLYPDAQREGAIGPKTALHVGPSP